MKKILLALLLIPGLLNAQRIIINTSMQVPPSGPTVLAGPGSLSFTSQAGTASASQVITYSFLNTTAGSNSITLPSFIEGSIDAGGSWHTGFTSQNNCNTCTLLVRVTAATTSGVYGPTSVSFSSTTGGAGSAACAITATVSSLGVSPTSISGLNGIAGTAGTSQTVTLTFTAPSVSATAPVGTEISKDAGSTYASSQTITSGSPLGVLIRTQASAGAGTISGNLSFSASGVTTVNVPISGTITTSSVKDSIRVQTYITVADTVSGVSHLNGDPSTANRSVTGGNSNSITVATLNTSFWGQSGGACIGANNGLTSTTTFPGLPGIMKETVLNTNGYDTTKHLIQISGLKASTSYKVRIAGTFGFNFNFVGKYNVAGSAWQTAQTLNCNGITNPNPTAMVWTLNSSSTGIITIAFGLDQGTSGSLLGGISAIICTEQ